MSKMDNFVRLAQVKNELARVRQQLSFAQEIVDMDDIDALEEMCKELEEEKEQLEATINNYLTVE